MDLLQYLNVTLTKDNNITTGKVYRHVIEGEVRFVLLRIVLSKVSDGNDGSDAATTSARLFKSFLMSPTQSKTGLSVLPRFQWTRPTKRLMSASLR